MKLNTDNTFFLAFLLLLFSLSLFSESNSLMCVCMCEMLSYH